MKTLEDVRVAEGKNGKRERREGRDARAGEQRGEAWRRRFKADRLTWLDADGELAMNWK